MKSFLKLYNWAKGLWYIYICSTEFAELSVTQRLVLEFVSRTSLFSLKANIVQNETLDMHDTERIYKLPVFLSTTLSTLHIQSPFVLVGFSIT